MRNETRALFNQYADRQAELNNVPDATTKFTVLPSVQQTLESKIQESSDFLKLINIVPVDDLKGEKLGLGVSGTVASRTDTSGAGERQTRDVATIDKNGYECRKTDYDTHIRYATLDMWSKFKDFQPRVRDQVLKRCALDRIMIGFNGSSAAATTNRTNNPLLQDVNVGWLQGMRSDAAAQVMDEGGQAGKIVVGNGGDYTNLDALVYDLSKTIIKPWYQEDPELVAIVGRDLMHDKLFPLVSNPEAPTEILAAQIVRSQRRLGGLSAVVVPFFPPGAVLVTRLDNLSIYYQAGARRRAVIDNPKKDRVEHYESSNDAFVVEDYDGAALAENVEVL